MDNVTFAKTQLPNNLLTFVITDISPLLCVGEPIKHRTVQIELTAEQLQKLALKHRGMSGSNPIYEEISSVYLEPKEADNG